MPNKLLDKAFPDLPRIAQINSFYCGPASIQMLLGYYGEEVDQESLVDAANVRKKIKDHGVSLPEIGESVKKLFPQYQFWYKYNSTIPELSQIINKHQIPVGVEWQGVFDYPDEEIQEDEDDDAGHISVVTAIDTQQNYIYIADPDMHYAGKDRKFSILQFERRWWDINTIIDPQTKKRQEIDDFHGLFLITQSYEEFPRRYGLIPV